MNDDVIVPPYRTKGFHNPARMRGVAEAMGLRGEQIFHLLLEEEGIEHIWWKVKKPFTHQFYDFKIGTWTFDVKSRPLGKDEFLMKETDPIDCDFYVAVNVTRMPDHPVFVKGEKVYGYLTKDEVAALPIDESLPLAPGRRCPYEKLHPIEELLKILRGVK